MLNCGAITADATTDWSTHTGRSPGAARSDASGLRADAGGMVGDGAR